MEIIIKIVVVCLIMIKTSSALENTTAELEHLSKIQKREKHFLLEDDPSEGPEQKRDERHSILTRNTIIEPKVKTKPTNFRIQPKIMTAPIYSSSKPVLQKQLNIPTAQRIPTKIPIILKTKVVPNLSHTIPIKTIESRFNDSIAHIDTSPKIADPLSQYLSKHIPFTIEDKGINIESRFSGDNLTTCQERRCKETQNKDFKDDRHKEENDKPMKFFIDEPDSSTRSLYESENIGKNISKEYPITKKLSKEIKEENYDQTEEPDLVHISNGTHLITIKKLKNPDKYKIENFISRDGFVQSEIEEKMYQRPPDFSDEEYLRKSTNGFNKEENTLPGIINMDMNYKKKEKDDSITITDHNYEEVEERTPISQPIPVPPATMSNDGNYGSWSYLQTQPNSYTNPYYQKIYDQYRKNFGTQPPIYYSQEKTVPCENNQEYVPYYPTEIRPSNCDSYNYCQYPNTFTNDQIVNDNSICKESVPENNFDKIWRRWKDVQSKIKENPNKDDYNTIYDIDIRRDMEDNKVPDGFKVATAPINLGGYYHNPNNGLIYPYVNPSFRYMC